LPYPHYTGDCFTLCAKKFKDIRETADWIMGDTVKKKTLVSWSSGKDSAWALHLLRQQKDIDVVGLFCTFNSKYDRGAMHGVRIELISQQAESIGLPLNLIPIPDPCSDSEYRAIMENFMKQVKSREVDAIAFGDLFLEDIRSYRESSLAATGITALFPLWRIDTKKLSEEMINSGVRAKITAIDPNYLSADFAGHDYDKAFLAHIPESVDPCGENGEFHSFVYDGPMFKSRVNVCTGETVTRNGFIYTDVLPC
jgi:uncharacterized protein (TIGR00290 family)